jgi:hypothetical protein
MDDDRMDNLLGRDDGIEPSAGFAAAVMAAVHAEAAGRDVLKFPWRLTAPGFAGVGLCLAASVASLFAPPAAHPVTTSGPDVIERLLASAVDVGTSPAIVWVALSCVLTWTIVHLSMQIIRRAS